MVAKLSWGAGQWAHGAGGHWGTILVSGALENKERKMPKIKGAWAITGLGHGLINWCCEWQCPLYPRKQTFGREPLNVCL